jgi:hypothetical protein
LIAAVAAVAMLLPGCGFNDQLTRRGFIHSGDTICGTTILRSIFAANAAVAQGRPVTQTGRVHSLARAYATAAVRIRKLPVSADDEAMRGRMARAFTAEASRLEAATHESPGAGVTGAVLRAYAAYAPAARSMQAYGFNVCGGSAAAQRA